MASEKLTVWQDRLSQSDQAYSTEVGKMDHREELYKGSREIKPIVETEKNTQQATHLRNIVFENIESQVSSQIPAAKVTPRRKEDEELAKKIEHLIRNEMDRLPIEELNDMAERTVPIQGGTGYWINWDNSKRTGTTVGEVDLDLIHPKQLGPQPGVFTGTDDMDWIIIKVPTTKESVHRRYGVSVSEEGESEPQLRTSEQGGNFDDAVTLYIGYERSPETDKINMYAWCNDIEVEDLENYQARRRQVCAHCGRPRPTEGQVILNTVVEQEDIDLNTELTDKENAERTAAGQKMAGMLADELMNPGKTAGGLMEMESVQETVEERKYDGGPCPWCGAEEWTEQEMEYEQVNIPMRTESGIEIEGATPALDEQGMPALKPALIPYYSPDCFPVVLQKSVSVFGQLWGNSDVDAIEDQQNTTNRIEKKIIDRLVKAGSKITLPDDAMVNMSSSDGDVIRLNDPSQKAMIDTYEFTGNLQYEMAYLAQVYEESRQILGITDSMQGRRDPTATSAVAKEFSAQQAAGRMESKRVLKNAAYARIYEMIFKFWLAYADEPREISYMDEKGKRQYETISRYDFLKQDADGNYYWEDQFLFATDTSASLAANRQAMWQETRMNLQTGAFGDPTQLTTLILFWTKMEELHYPGAASTKQYLEDQLKDQQAQQAQMMQQAAMNAQMTQSPAGY